MRAAHTRFLHEKICPGAGAHVSLCDHQWVCAQAELHAWPTANAHTHARARTHAHERGCLANERIRNLQ
eukprot:1993448-Pleurochrysis_carterae.AAC.1